MSQTGIKICLRRAKEAFLWTKQTYFWEMVQNYDFSDKKKDFKKTLLNAAEGGQKKGF